MEKTMADNEKGTTTVPEEKSEDLIVYKSGEKEAQIPSWLNEEFNKRLSAQKSKLVKDYDDQIKQIISEKESISKEFMDLKKSLLTDKEKQELERKEKEEAYLRLQNEAEENWKLYSDTMTSKALHDSISTFDVWNSKQVVTLLKSLSKSEVDKAGKVMFEFNGQKVTADEMVKTFLTDPTNANLLKTTLSSGGGTTKSNTTGVNTIKRSAFDALSDSDKIEYSKKGIKVVD